VGRYGSTSRADDLCWRLTIIILSYKRPQIRRSPLVKTTGLLSQRVLEESTMRWFAALLFLLGFSTLDIIVKSTSGPGTPPAPPATSSSKQLAPQ
jgi:hypothetical protein